MISAVVSFRNAVPIVSTIFGAFFRLVNSKVAKNRLQPIFDCNVLFFFIVEYTKIFTFLFEYRIYCFLYFFSAYFDILYSIFLGAIESNLTFKYIVGVYSQINVSVNHWRRIPPRNIHSRMGFALYGPHILGPHAVA